MGYPTQQQKVDYLFKKIGFTKTKTGVAEDQTGFTGNKKAPPNEAIASPLVIPSSSLWSDSSLIPATPPTSSTAHVGIYTAGSAYRMSVDTTVSNNRTFIARETWWNPSSAIQGDWIDTQFGSDYLVKVYMGDPSGISTNLSAAGTSGKDDVWFFDYSSGVLNFNGADLDGQLTGITTSNVYIVGYRYTGGKGAQPTAGVGTFSSLYVSGISTFAGDVYFDGETAGRDVVFDRSDNALKFKDNARAMFGDGGDLSIYHYNSGGSVKTVMTNQFGSGEFHIIHNGVLPFKIQQGSDDAIVVRPQAGGGSTSVELYCDNNLRLATTNTGINITDNLNVAGISTFVGIITASAGQNKIPSLYANYSDLPNASHYHGMFAHVHGYGRGYFAHAGAWMELVNKEVNGVVGTGTERYNIGPVDATSLKITGITTLGNIGVSTGLISGPAVTYIDPATVGDDTGTLVVKGNLQVEGTQTTVNSSTMTVTDKNIEIAKGAANDAAADGGGITVDSGDGDKTWNWVDATDSWTSSEHIRIPDDKVFGFASDTNTFISRPAGDHLRFTTSGSQRLRIYGAGQVFIGDASDSPPGGAIFGIVKIATVELSDSNRLIDQSNPAFIHVKNQSDTGTEAGLIIHSANAAAGAASIYGKKTTAYNSDLIFRLRTGASASAERVRIKSTGQVAIGMTNHTGSNTKLVVGTGSTTADAVAVINTNDQDVDVIRLSNFDGSTTTNKLEVHFDSSGHAGFDVGIPATTPVFEIRNTSGGGGRFRLSNDGKLLLNTTTVGDSGADDLTIETSTHTGITLRSGTTSKGSIYFSDTTAASAQAYVGYIQYNHGDNSLTLATNASQKVRIDSAGNTNVVGILTAQFLMASGGSDANKQNVKIGWMNSENLSTGGYNVIVGRRAGEGLNTGSNVVLIGANAGYSLTSQSGAVFIGNNAGNLSTQGNNVYIGPEVAKNSTSAQQNVIIGTYAGIDNQGNENTLIGYYSGRGNSGVTDGLRNTFVGSQSGFKIEGGDDNTSVGRNSLRELLGGNKNVAIGQQAGDALVSGNNNIIIGYQADASTNSTSNEITLGDANITKFRIPGIGVTFSDDIVILPAPIDASGDLTVGGNFKVVGVSTFSDDVTFTGASGNILFDKTQDRLEFDNNIAAAFGDGRNLRIFANNSNGQINNYTGDLYIQNDSSSTNEKIYIRAKGAEDSISATANSSVDLFYDNVKRFSTSGVGVTVTGLTDTDTLTTGNATFTGTISAGSTTGTDGYYLQSVGTGVTWAQFPTMRTNQTFTATADQTTFSFNYNVGFVDVFVNGVKLPTSEFTASNGSSVILDDGCFVNDTVELISYNTVPSSGSGAQTLNQLDNVTITGVPVIGETLQHNGSAFVNDYTPSATTTSTSQTAILSLAIATYRSVEYTVQITEGTKYHVTKILAIHDGTNVSFNEYGTLFTTSSLATFALDVNSGSMRLLATPASTNSTVFKVKFNAIKV